MGKCYFCKNEADKKYEFEYEGKHIQSYVCDECAGNIEDEERQHKATHAPEPYFEAKGDRWLKELSVICFVLSGLFLLVGINNSKKSNIDVIDMLQATQSINIGTIFAFLGAIFVVAYYCSKISNNMGNFK